VGVMALDIPGLLWLPFGYPSSRLRSVTHRFFATPDSRM
jgi:hypothetical protein